VSEESRSAAGSVTFIGTATTLIRFGGFTVLTDPNFLHRGQRAYLGYGLVTKRLTEPACTVAELPPLDAVVLSHLHGDHFDRVARRGLDHDLPVLTTPAAARRLQRWRFGQATGLRCWRSHTLGNAGRPARTLRVTAVPAQHAPGAARWLLPPVMGSVLEFGAPDGRTDLRVYVSGDTIRCPELSLIPHRFPDVDVAVLHLGGTLLPGGLMVTMDGHQGLDVLRLIDAALTIPVHHNDYSLFKSRLPEFAALVDAAGLTNRVRYLEIGDTLPLPPAASRPCPGRS
jgi:L-ascorbate metabolism protein UlaG (beta-lactamase superfamily)